jgi:diacylglycerol O-acyltransferase / wax synthase
VIVPSRTASRKGCRVAADHSESSTPRRIVTLTTGATARATGAGSRPASCAVRLIRFSIEDPGERLQAIAKANSRAKEHSRAIAPSLLLDVTQVITRAMFGFVLGVAAHTPLTHSAIHNVIISNVAGPRNKLYCLGAEIKALYPLGPIFHGSGLNITVMSLSGKLNVGIISCQQLVDDLWDLADRFEFELNELLGSRNP